MAQEEKFSDSPQENLRIENELMRIKLQAQFGDAFQMGTSNELTPEMENQFLKNILAFEESYQQGDFITVYECIGKPVYKAVETMTAAELNNATNKLLGLLKEKNVQLDFSDGPYDDATIFKFITEELFNEEVAKERVEGMINGFIYEEFHPNHKVAIERLAHKFLGSFFTRDFEPDPFVLSDDIITFEGQQMKRDELLKKLQLFFDAFKNFADDGYNIGSINFELQPEQGRGMGFAEGMLKYEAAIDNGETIHYEGPYKLYMQMEDNYWSVFYFVVPGFKW